MTINKDNYEAFLLDYIEGNLSAEQTAELMLFLEQHPEIESGIEDFKIVSVNKEEAVFDAKRELKRKEFVVNDDLIEGLIVSFVNGDLSAAEEKKLMQIVNENPAYKTLFDQYIITRLQPGNEVLTDKVLLKGHLPVTAENAEYFIIAETEGVLTSAEKKSLDQYRSAFPGIKKLSVAYAGTKLNDSENIIFEGKSSLKRKEGIIISLWMRYASVAAAACLILYVAFFTGNETEKAGAVAEEKQLTESNEKENLVADDNSVIKDENNTVEELNPNDISNSVKEDLVANHSPVQHREKSENPITPQVKEPVIDGGFAQDDEHQHSKNDHAVLFAREEIKQIKNDDQYTLANVNTNVGSLNEDDFITPGQYVRNWAKKTFFTEIAEEKHQDQTTELADNTALRLKGTNATIQNKEAKDFKEYGFSIGKFSFQRRVRK